MNHRHLFLTAGLALCALVRPAAAAETSTERVGLYDSRIVAYAHFWSGPERQARDATMAAGRAAKAANDPAKFKEISGQLSAAQKRSHLQVFSTAPADEALAVLKDKLPALHQELGVTRLVSQWDEAALATVPAARRIDVTDRLVREFLPAPDEKQQKTIAEMKKAKPMPLAKAKELADAGKL